MAAITSIKDPLVNLNTNAHRQTHVDLQQPFEDIQNFTWLLQLRWSMSNIVTDKKWVTYKAFFSSLSTFHTACNQSPDKHEHKADADITAVLCNDLRGAQRNAPVCKQQKPWVTTEHSLVVWYAFPPLPPTWKMRSQFWGRAAGE